MELMPTYDGHVSFWGRATVERSASTGAVMLSSYGTTVAMVDAAGRFHRLWGGWSRTTMRHIVEFVRQFAGGQGPLTKKAWLALPVEAGYWQPARQARDDLLSMEAKA